MKITDVRNDVFSMNLEDLEDYRYTRIRITRVFTNEEIIGYGFCDIDNKLLIEEIKPGLIGKDPRDIIQLLSSGLLKGCASIENALWDIAGKVARVPVRNLLGSVQESMDYYLTCVWPGKDDQSRPPTNSRIFRTTAISCKGSNRQLRNLNLRCPIK